MKTLPENCVRQRASCFLSHYLMGMTSICVRPYSIRKRKNLKTFQQSISEIICIPIFTADEVSSGPSQKPPSAYQDWWFFIPFRRDGPCRIT